MRLRIASLLAAIALVTTACYPWPNSPTGDFIGLANAEVGTTPSYASQGFWCYLFVNQVGEQTIPGWQDAEGPGKYSDLLQPDPNGPQPGDIVEFGDPTQDDQVTHVGIVLDVSTGDFSSIEGNSAEDPGQVAINYHSTRGPDPTSGLEPVVYLLP